MARSNPWRNSWKELALPCRQGQLREEWRLAIFSERMKCMSLPRVEIEYCRQCKWLLRAAWMAQELPTTFEEELGGVTLVPGIGGVFVVRVEGEVVWSRQDEGRFPEITELKQRVRDKAAPGKMLGHSDRKRGQAGKAEVS
jgi:selenoprotein W-related protein